MGACAQRDNSEVFICFRDNKNPSPEESRKCYRATAPRNMFHELPMSTFSHNGARIAVISGKMDFDNEMLYLHFTSDYLIAVGGGVGFEDENKKTELYSSSNIWSTESDYPYGAEYSNS